MIEWIRSLFGNRPRQELHTDVKEAIYARDVAVENLGGAIKEVDRMKNGIIRDYEEAEKGIKGRP